MDKQNDGLWRGGPWEQPGRPVTAPDPVPVPRRSRPRPLLPQRGRHRLPWFAWLFIALFIFGIVGTALNWGEKFDFDFRQDSSGPSSPPADTVQEEQHRSRPPSIPRAPFLEGETVTLSPEGEASLTFTQIYDKNLPSIVSIGGYSENALSTGTGIILTEDGYIITNAHVVAEAFRVTVDLHDSRILEARLVGFDADEDLAVLKVEAEGLTPAEFGDSNLLRCGDPVAALGDSLGYRSTITEGIVSALDREMDMNGVSMTLIQTSAAINFGSSGGALINQYGQVVGITTIKIVANDGSAEALGFAIPSRRVRYVANTLISGSLVRPGVFGFTVSLYPRPTGGLEVMAVEEWSDCWLQGMRAGDTIVAVNGSPVTDYRDLIRLKLELGEGDEAVFTCLQNGVRNDIRVRLVARPAV